MPASTGKAAILGIVGDPVTHSLSPLIQEYWLARHGIDGAYIPFRQQRAELDGLCAALKTLDLRGFNVTVPYKAAILPYLDQIDPEAARIGAVNTVVAEGGRWRGYNTDGQGFLRSLGDRTFQTIAVLGAGGAARAITHALLGGYPANLRLANRDAAKAARLAAELESRAPGKITVIDWERRAEMLPGCDLLVNTTTLGMHGMPPLPLALDALPESALVADIVYAPLVTPLLADAGARGLPTVDGLGMLLGQAAASFERWFGITPVIDDGLRQRLIEARGGA